MSLMTLVISLIFPMDWLSSVMTALEEAQRRGLIERDALHIRPTALGQRFLNELLQLFLP